jgi:hypothetical protein
MLRLATVVVVFGLTAIAACDEQVDGECVCTPCAGAISLFVVDNAGQPATDWTVAATHDGESVDTFTCNTDVRAGSNQCSFGDALGVYEVTVVGPTGSVQATSRLASRVGQNCCACLASTLEQVALP